ncbi:MAG: DegV family protein [Lachnospiraceae bacterium]|nr:DegV family protein [Lachnospiraceae bacterium]
MLNLVEIMQNSLDENTDFNIPVGVVHANCIEDAQAVANLVKENTKFTNVIINDISPSIGTHTGPLALGLMYYGKVQ